MPITRSKKEDVITTLKGDLASAKSVVFAKFHKLSVAKVSDLRRKFRAIGGKYVVAKKTLVSRAFQDAGMGELPKIAGEVALVIGSQDELSIFKTASDFAKKEKEAFSLTGGFFEGKFIDAITAKALGSIPSREILLAQVMQVMQGNIRKFMYVIGELSKKGQPN